MKNKGVAVVLCFFFGGLGVHKFYLGESVAGIFYFLFSWTFIPVFIAFFEFFILLFMSESAFNVKYNRGMMSENPGGAVSAKDATSALADLKKLYDAGVITVEEYEEKRQKLLKSL